MDRDKQEIMQAIGNYSAQLEANKNRKENDSWQRSLQLANMAAKMKPYESMGFSLGRLLFQNADKWFGHRRKDGTKHDTAAGAAGTQENDYDFSQFKTNDPMQMLANAGDSTAQYVLDAKKNDPFRHSPQEGSFGTPEWAANNGINIQQDTLTPIDTGNGQGLQATSTNYTFSAPNNNMGYDPSQSWQNMGGMDVQPMNPGNAGIDAFSLGAIAGGAEGGMPASGDMSGLMALMGLLDDEDKYGW